MIAIIVVNAVKAVKWACRSITVKTLHANKSIKERKTNIPSMPSGLSVPLITKKFDVSFCELAGQDLVIKAATAFSVASAHVRALDLDYLSTVTGRRIKCDTRTALWAKVQKFVYPQ